MGKIIKIGDQYFVEFIGNGLLFQKLAGQDKSKAEKMLKDIEESLVKEETDIFVVKEMDYKEFCQKLTKHIEEIFSLRTQARLLSTWNHFHSFLKRNYPNLTKLKEISPAVIEQYKVELIKELLSKKERLISFTIFLLRMMFEFAVKSRGLNDNPTLHVQINYGKRKFDRAIYNIEFAKKLINQYPEYKEKAAEILKKGRDEKLDFKIEKNFNGYFFHHIFVLNLLDNGLTLIDVFKVLKLTDIARVMIYAPYEKSKLV